ncbi:DUF4158 domain-containing protein [Streptosporangium sandarakinum]
MCGAALRLAEDVEPDHGASRTAKWHRTQIRARQGVIYDERARAIAAEAMGEAALARNNPPDLINVALERLIEASLELPGFTTLDEMAARIRAKVNGAGGFAAQLADIEEVSAFHGDNYEVLAYRFFRRDRAVMFDLVAKLELTATSRDDSVLAALDHARAHEAKRRDFIPMPPRVEGSGDPESGIMDGRGTPTGSRGVDRHRR